VQIRRFDEEEEEREASEDTVPLSGLAAQQNWLSTVMINDDDTAAVESEG
jgi:hypothetical protein